MSGAVGGIGVRRPLCSPNTWPTTNPHQKSRLLPDAPKYQQAAADLKKLEEIEEQIKSEGTVREKNQDWLRSEAMIYVGRVP